VLDAARTTASAAMSMPAPQSPVLRSISAISSSAMTVVLLVTDARVLLDAQEHLLKKKRWLEGLRLGKTIKEMFDIPDATLEKSQIDQTNNDGRTYDEVHA
jgi:hypothetical protein